MVWIVIITVIELIAKHFTIFWSVPDTNSFQDNKEFPGVNQTFQQLKEEIYCRLPSALDRLEDAKLLLEFLQLLETLGNGTLPTNNISLLLTLETARWFSLKTTTKMWYSEETLVFLEMWIPPFAGKIPTLHGRHEEYWPSDYRGSRKGEL